MVIISVYLQISDVDVMVNSTSDVHCASLGVFFKVPFFANMD